MRQQIYLCKECSARVHVERRDDGAMHSLAHESPICPGFATFMVDLVLREEAELAAPPARKAS